MKQVVIENPVINSPYLEPTRRFKFTDDGITDEIVEARRISSYFIPIAKPITMACSGVGPFLKSLTLGTKIRGLEKLQA